MEIEFKKFLKKNKNNTFNKLNDFFNNYRIKFESEKIKEYEAKGILKQEAVIKARQSWVAKIDNGLEKVIFILLDDFCKDNNLKITTDKILKSATLNKELDLIRRQLLINFEEYSFLPDADFVIYKDNPIKILCILSIKNSFRERYTETPYWKLKLLQSEITKNIKVFMLTPDNDDEISFIKNNKPRKARIVMEYELDGIYLAKENFEKSNKIKDIKDLKEDIKKLI